MDTLSSSRQGMASKAAAGGIVSTVPLGYRIAGYQASARAEIDYAFSPTVTMAFQLAADPANSLRDILAALLLADAVGKHGKSLSLSTLQRMLANPFYAGLIRFANMGKAVQGQHEPIVTLELLKKVRHNLSRRRCSW